MVPGDRLFCLFVEDMSAGDTFKDWPLHLTLVPWFRVGTSSQVLTSALQERLHDVRPFDVMVQGEARFGARKRLVGLIAEPTLLHTIEHEARELLRSHQAWMVDETTKKRRPFRPHVTEQTSGRLHDGDTFHCGAVYIVEQQGAIKEVMSRIDL